MNGTLNTLCLIEQRLMLRKLDGSHRCDACFISRIINIRRRPRFKGWQNGEYEIAQNCVAHLT